jgi:hypothetical protein
MRRLTAIGLAFAALPAASGASSYPLNPGYWEVSTDWLGLVKKTELYCVAPERIVKFMLGPCNHHYTCSYPIQEVADGKVHFEGEIRGNDELYHVKGDATYTPTSLDMLMHGSGHWRIVPVAGVHASVKAHFLSAECPAGAKKL